MKTPTFLMPFQQALQDPMMYENSYKQIPCEIMNQLKEKLPSKTYIDIIIFAWDKMPAEDFEYFLELLIMELDEELPYPSI